MQFSLVASFKVHVSLADSELQADSDDIPAVADPVSS